MSSSIASREVAVDFAAAEKLFAQHQEYRTEVGAHEKSLQEFLEAAQKLIKSGHPNSKDIKEKSQSVQTSWVLLLESVGKKQDHLEQVKEVQRFKREADQLEGWLYARGSDILSEDVGDSLEAVEELLKKQDEFEKMLLAKGEHFEDLTKLTNQEVENEKLMKEKERELEKQKEMERQKKRKEKDRLEKERRKALREEEERKRKEIIEQQRQQEEKRRQEERREKERAKQKEILEEQRQQEEKRRQEERREKEGAKRKEIVEQLRQQEERRRQEKLKQQKEMKRKQLDMEMKQEETKRKEREGNRNERQNKKIMEDKRKENQIEEAKVRPEQVSRQSSSPTQTVPRPICEGLLQRKQEFNERGQRPGIRAWQTFFVVLADGRLEFYSDKGAASRQEGYASPALDLKDATCTALDQELPGKNAFRLQLQNDSLFLFNTRSEKDYNQWIREINESIHKYSQVSQPHLESPRSPNALLATNGHGFSPKNEKHVRPLPTPMIKVTSFDGDEAIENDDNVHMYDDDDDDDDSVDLIDSFPESPPDVPPPLVPEDIDIDIEPDIPPPPHESHHSYPEDVPEEYTDVLSADDIHPEFYPDAPTDFNDNTIPDIPCIPPPDVPPFDLGDLEEGAVDDDDLIDYPKAPPPPVATFPKEPPALGVEETDYLSSSSEGVPSPPPPLVPTKPDVSNLPSRPHRKKRAPPPPREARYRSDSQDSDDFPTAVLPPKPPVKPKPKTVDSHDDKKHEKKKGMFGFFKKKK